MVAGTQSGDPSDNESLPQSDMDFDSEEATSSKASGSKKKGRKKGPILKVSKDLFGKAKNKLRRQPVAGPSNEKRQSSVQRKAPATFMPDLDTVRQVLLSYNETPTPCQLPVLDESELDDFAKARNVIYMLGRVRMQDIQDQNITAHICGVVFGRYTDLAQRMKMTPKPTSTRKVTGGNYCFFPEQLLDDLTEVLIKLYGHTESDWKERFRMYFASEKKFERELKFYAWYAMDRIHRDHFRAQIKVLEKRKPGKFAIVMPEGCDINKCYQEHGIESSQFVPRFKVAPYNWIPPEVKDQTVRDAWCLKRMKVVLENDSPTSNARPFQESGKPLQFGDPLPAESIGDPYASLKAVTNPDGKTKEAVVGNETVSSSGEEQLGDGEGNRDEGYDKTTEP